MAESNLKILKKIRVNGDPKEVEVTDAKEREELWKRSLPNMTPEEMLQISINGFPESKMEVLFYPEREDNAFTQTVAYKRGDVEIGMSRQTFVPCENGAQFLLCSVRKQFQDKGYAKQIQRNRVGMMDAMGITHMHMSASGVGSYVWAKFCVPKSHENPHDQWEKIKQHCNQKLDEVRDQLMEKNHGALLVKAIENMLSKDSIDATTLWRLSDLKIPVKNKTGKDIELGKHLLIGANYECEFDTTDIEARKRFNTYVNQPNLRDASVTDYRVSV
jgi:hypothetical protein